MVFIYYVYLVLIFLGVNACSVSRSSADIAILMSTYGEKAYQKGQFRRFKPGLNIEQIYANEQVNSVVTDKYGVFFQFRPDTATVIDVEYFRQDTDTNKFRALITNVFLNEPSQTQRLYRELSYQISKSLNLKPTGDFGHLTWQSKADSLELILKIHPNKRMLTVNVVPY